MANELTNKLVIAADKLRVAQSAAKEKYLLYSNSNRAMLDKQKKILKLRTELAVEEAELVVCQTRVMDAQEAHRTKDAEVAKWSAIVRLKHSELMELGRRSSFKCSDTRLEAKMMAEECLLEEEAVRADLIREEERKAMEVRRKAEEEQREAEKLREATKEEELRKAEAVKKEREAEDARRKAVAASEARQRQLLESNLKKQLNNIQLQNLGVASQPSGGVRPKERLRGAEGHNTTNEPLVAKRTGGSGSKIMNRVGLSLVSKDLVPRDSQQYW